ncbi:hypothetical protein BT93_L5382 [Corymbia citriodora subsp. variegata]|uniref:S-protein homolog n=1 Tax=Corymbia citriodora subsp. variegata TaxID=360336 RepID=A0A8T0CXC5_CORYI|nr:hypothetical protein BT93_L5382 [Corymbia citriodora subsp. variegata]
MTAMMNSSAKLTFICFLLLTSCAGDFWVKTHAEIQNNIPAEAPLKRVEIQNNLPAGTTLIVHCKSIDVDLGVHHLTTQSWSFSFNPLQVRKSVFICGFAWPGQLKLFDIYVASRDMNACVECIWKISPDGPCRLDQATNKFDVCFSWDPPAQYERKPLI